MKLKKGDKVRVTAGKDRGKEGVVEKVWPKNDRVTVPGVNMYKRHLKPRGEGQHGGIHDVVRPLAAGKVALICPKCKQVTRLSKRRVCRKCGQEV